MAVIGRPTKRTPELEQTAKRALEIGLSYKLTAHICGVAPFTLREWRKADPDFAASLEQGRAEGIKAALCAVIQAWERDWRAAAWFIEHRAFELMPEAPMQADDADDSEVETIARKLHAVKKKMEETVPDEKDEAA